MKAPVPQLSVMMFLQFFIWGSWYVTANLYFGALREQGVEGWTDSVTDWTYSVGPIAAIVAPLFLGAIADRFFASQRVLGALHLLGAALMYTASTFAGEPGASDTFVWLLFGYMLCYMPTLGLTNTVTFSHITDQEKQFPIIRVFGTLGWIAAGIVVSKGLGADREATQFVVAAGASAVLGVFSFFLPQTPPPAAGKAFSLGDSLGLGAIGMLRDRSFAVFLVSSFLICIPLAAYYARGGEYAGTAFEDVAFVMGFGQWAEVLFMLLMPLCFARLGVKYMLVIGMLAWVVRYGLFSAAADQQVAWMILGGIVLHGICYDFFFVTGQIYVDQRAAPAIRAQAQGLLVVVTQGLGMFIGAQVIGEIVASNTTGEGAASERDWTTIWLIPCILAAAVMVLFAVLFRDRRGTPLESSGSPTSAVDAP